MSLVAHPPVLLGANRSSWNYSDIDLAHLRSGNLVQSVARTALWPFQGWGGMKAMTWAEISEVGWLAGVAQERRPRWQCRATRAHTLRVDYSLHHGGSRPTLASSFIVGQLRRDI